MVFEHTSTRVFIYSMIPTSYLTIITLSCNRVIIHFSRSVSLLLSLLIIIIIIHQYYIINIRSSLENI